MRQLMERLGVARAIDAGVRVLRRCKWYRESDHILTLIYSMLSGGSRLHDVNRLGQDEALKRVLGSDRIPHATTIGKFLWRFGDDEHDKQRLGTKEVLPGTIDRVSKHFRQVRMRADSGYYNQALVNICEQRGVEFFIVAKQHRNLMNAVREIPDREWKSFAHSDLQAGDRGRRRRRRRANLKRKIAIRRKPDSRFKGEPEIAGMMFKPKSWKKARRYVIKRTPIVDKDDQQLYLDDGLRRYAYWIVVSNSKRSNEQVLRIAQGRGNQETLIKDFKYGLGLAHIPTGTLAANQAYFMIAALAWNLKTWLLNLPDVGDGAVMRFQRFRYQWIWQAGVVAKSARNTVALKLPAGEYFPAFWYRYGSIGDSLTITDTNCAAAGSSMSREPL